MFAKICKDKHNIDGKCETLIRENIEKYGARVMELKRELRGETCSKKEDFHRKESSEEELEERARLGNLGANALDRALRLDENLQLNPQGSQVKAVETAYIEAAAVYLELLRLMQGSVTVTDASIAVQNRIEEILDRVEQLKSGGKKHSSAPSKSSTLTQSEIEVLKKSSKMGNKTFMPFLESDVRNPEAFMTKEPYEDPDGNLSLSSSQRSHFYKFARPSEIASRQGKKNVCLFQSISPYNITQSCVQDCSFIASLCIAAAYERRWRKRLVTACMYPQSAKGAPYYNPCGKYVIKLWLNGVARSVVVDDRLPVDRNYNLLCSHVKSDSHLELWVSLLEKAFLKTTAQGYEFPGSNSGVDLLSLTGWIPERIYFSKKKQNLRDHETTPERMFQRLHSALSFGDVLTTASVGSEISEIEADAVGLVTEHAYGILNVVEAPSGRFLFCKNPWASKGWKGKFSPDDMSWTPKIGRELHYDYEKARRKKWDDGLFWIRWEDFHRYFTSIQFSWNPNLFKYKYTNHKTWSAEGSRKDTYCIRDNPQYLIVPSAESIKKRAVFYILLSRHVNLEEQRGALSNDFLASCIYSSNKSNGLLTYPNDDVIFEGVYSNNPHVLIKIDADARYPRMNLVLRQHTKTREIEYSLSVLSTENFSVGLLTSQFPSEIISGSWNPSGGRMGSSTTFSANPQYRLTTAADKPVPVEIVLKTNITLSVNLTCVRGGKKVDYISKTDEVFSSGDYRTAVCVCSGTLRPDTSYTLVASTWEEGDVGAYSLEVICPNLDLKKLN